MPSTPTAASLSVPESKAIVADLRDGAQEFETKSGVIIGRGAEVVQQMKSTAVEFTELVSEHLRERGTESIEAARTAMQGAVWGGTITGQWADSAETYQQLAANYSNQWAEAVSSGFGVTAASAGVTSGMPGDVVSKVMDNAMADAGASQLATMQGVVSRAYEKYKEDAKTSGAMLTQGPTPANLKALAAGGGTTWAMFNAFGAAAGVPKVDGADGKALAELMREVLGEDKKLTPELLHKLQAMYALAEWAQDHPGDKLSSDQIAYLEQFFAGLDQPFGPKPFGEIPTTLYHIPVWLDRAGASDADQAAVLAAMGGGLMVLSNPGFGGGMKKLPDSLYENLGYYTGDFDEQVGSLKNVEQLSALAPMFGAATAKGLKDLKAGKDFSAALTLAVAEEFALFHERKPPGYMPGGAPGLEKHVADLLGVTTRKLEANADLLTGKFEHPEYGKDTPEHVMRALFGYNWKDDGKAASGLIDWIPSATTGTDPELKLRAQESAYNLFTVMGSEDKSKHWDTSAYEFFTDAYGRIGDYDKAPLGVANPVIAKSLGSTAISYLDHFDDAESLDRSGGEEESMPSWLKLGAKPGDTDMYLNLQERANFFEIVMGGKDAANDLGEAVYTRVFLESSGMPDWTEKGSDEAMGNRHGTLIGLLESGIGNVHADAVGDTAADAEQSKQNSAWIRAGAAISKEVIATNPYFRTVGGRGWDIVVKELHEIGKWGPGVSETNGWAFSGGSEADKPSLAESHSKETLGLEVSQSLVDHALQDPKRQLDLDDVRAVEPRLLEKDANGNEQLRSADDLLGANNPKAGTKQITVEDAQMALRKLYPGKADDWYDDYILHLITQRDEITGGTAK